MKTFKTISVLAFVLCFSLYSKAQFLCGAHPYFNATIHGDTAEFHNYTTMDSAWYLVERIWTFGDGTTDTSSNPVHVYNANGTYTACLTVRGYHGGGILCSDSFCRTITITTGNLCGNAQASFTMTNNGGGVVALQSTSTGVPSGCLYQWWMDGNAVTNPNPNTAFTLNNVGPGYHTFCLYVYANSSTFCDSSCRTENIGSNTCNITAAFQYAIHPTWVSFYPAAITVSGVYHHWNFGDGTDSLYTTNINWLTHSFPSNPNTVTYRVCHYVYLSGTNCVDSNCQYIVVPGSGIGSCGTASFTQTVSGGVIHAQSNSTGVDSTTQYQWTIYGPNGNLIQTQTGRDNNITSQTLPAGTYQVCLYLYLANQTFCDSTCHSVSITSSTPCSGITANFSFIVLGNDSVHFETHDTNTAAHHYWNFGDGVSGSGMDVGHQYANAGTYRVCSYVYIPGISCVDSFCQYVTVNSGNPCGNLSAQWTQTYQLDNSVKFVPGNNTLNVTSLWTFGDGSSSTDYDPSHCYTAAGFYTVCHYVSIPGTTCRDTSCHGIQANACSPCSGFGVSLSWGNNPGFGGYNVEANVTPNTSTPVSFVWSNGDTGRVIRVTQPGVYCVTATNANGCTATACDSVGGPHPCNLQVAIYPQSSGGVYVLSAHATGGTPPYTFYWNNGLSNSNVLTVTAPGTYCVIVYDANQCVADNCFTVPGAQGTDTICGVVFEDLNGNGVLDSTEHGIVNAEVHAGSYVAHADANGYYQIVVPSGTYSITYCAPTGYSYTIPVSPNNNGLNCNGYYQVWIQGGTTHCGYNFGIQNNSVSICGTVYLDANNNHVQDNGETGIANVHIEIVSATGQVYHAHTDQNGQYCVLVPPGTYTLHAASNSYNTCPITPQSISVTATTPGQSLTGNDFAAYCQPGQCDLRVELTPHTTVTAGYPAWYSIRVCNNGSSVSGGTLNMFYDAAVIYDHSSPAETSINTSTRTVTWNITNLMPGNCMYFWVVFNADSNVAVGQHVFTLVNITPDANCNDINMNNNVDTTHQEATASWDPNNKLAYTTNYETNPAYQWVSSVNANQRIEYVINFQNLGNAPAINVVVKDVISPDLDLNSFELLGTSHPSVVTINSSGLNVKYSDIMLSPASLDEANSHGWVRFAINSINGLPGGHVIADPADVYFDYNQPVTTNDAAVTMLDASGIDEITNYVTVVIAPNPMSQFAEIKLNSSRADNFIFRVTDLTGRLVAENNSNGNTLRFERNSLAAGLYTYQVIQNNGVVAKGKLVMQ